MRTFTFKGLFLTAVFMLLGCLSIQAADNDLITKQITIKLEEAGTLPNKIASSRKYKITNLKIIGEINGTDWSMIREMAGRDYSGNSTDGKLSVLDLSEAKIVKGGDCYLNNGYDYTSNDVIGDRAFLGCSVLTSLTLPAGITKIGSYAFRGCSGLTSLTLPAGITSIGDNAFWGCNGLKEVRFCINGNLDTYLTKGHPYIYVYSCGIKYYINDKEITSIEIPSNVTTLGDCVFQGCSGLTSLTLPAGITSIGDNAFWGCNGLKEVRFCINGNLDTYLTKGHPYIYVYSCGIKYYINDKEITSIEIPSNVTTLGDCVFQGCSGLTSLTLPAGITSIGDGAFAGCSGLTSLNLPAGITEIGGRAFQGCSGLTSLTLSAGITKIGDDAFNDCSGLKEVRFCINDNLDTYLTKGHPYIDVDCGIKYYINDKEITSIEIPSNVTTLGDCVFQGFSGLTSLDLPAGITEIGSSAFQDCSGLTSLTLPAGITSIGSYAFLRCSGLTSLTLPAGITKIGAGTFSGCSGLTSIYVYAEKVPRIDSYAFAGVDAKKCTLYVPMGTRDDYRLSVFGDYFENIVEFEATGIDKTTTSTDVEEVVRYSVNGQRLSAPTKGLNIVKYSDGSVKKVAVE